MGDWLLQQTWLHCTLAVVYYTAAGRVTSFLRHFVEVSK